MAENKKNRFALAACTLIVACAIGLALFVLMNWKRWEFERQIVLDLPCAEVVDRAGPPALALKPGDKLPAWGNSNMRRLDHVAWVYYVFPQSQHRFVLLIDDDRVVKIEHNQN